MDWDSIHKQQELGDTYCSIVCGNARNNKHQKEGDDDLKHERLEIGSNRYSSKERMLCYRENSAQRGTGKNWTQ